MTKPSKRQAAIALMEANRDKTYEQVSQLISEALGITVDAGRGYYQYMVKIGAVTGIEKTWGRGKRLDSQPKKAKSKPKAKEVTPVELSQELQAMKADMKAKNLETLRQVSAKRKMIRVVDVPETTDKRVESEWEVATSVSRDEIKGIIPASLHKGLGLL